MGEGRPDPFYHMKDIRQTSSLVEPDSYTFRARVGLCETRGEGSSIKRATLQPYLVVSAPSAGVSNVVLFTIQNKERMVGGKAWERG